MPWHDQWTLLRASVISQMWPSDIKYPDGFSSVANYSGFQLYVSQQVTVSAQFKSLKKTSLFIGSLIRIGLNWMYEEKTRKMSPKMQNTLRLKLWEGLIFLYLPPLASGIYTCTVASSWCMHPSSLSRTCISSLLACVLASMSETIAMRLTFAT